MQAALTFFPTLRVQFVIKVEGLLTNDMSTLNDKIHHLLRCNKRDNPVLVDLTFDRIAQLGKLRHSVLENPRVHPCVQYVVRHSRCRSRLCLFAV